MVKNCSNCKHAVKYTSPSFLDGKCVGEKEHTVCTSKDSVHWYREVNNLITCNGWEKQDEKN